MREVNFLPYEIKGRTFKKKKDFVNYSMIIIFIANIIITLHISQGICEINFKKKTPNKVESQVFNDNYKEKSHSLDFFKENIVDHFLYDVANIKGSTLNLKVSIKDENEFLKRVKDLEEIKKCNIKYLIAPYEENTMLKFEVGLEVK